MQRIGRDTNKVAMAMVREDVARTKTVKEKRKFAERLHFWKRTNDMLAEFEHIVVKRSIFNLISGKIVSLSF